MKNKGFTLVELLAVIAILAILVIVAMPNVIEMFNQAKLKTFATEVQKIMDTSTTQFTQDALQNSGETIYYSSEQNNVLGAKQLDMSGNEKNYFIEMDRNGEFKRIVVYDDNFCYDIYARGTNSDLNDSKSKLIIEDINKTIVDTNDIWNAQNESINITVGSYGYTVKGCESTSNASKENLKIFKVNNGMSIFGSYLYEDGMTWEEWVNSEYNVDGYKIDSYDNIYIMDSEKLKKMNLEFTGNHDRKQVFINDFTCVYHSPSDKINGSTVISLIDEFEHCF